MLRPLPKDISDAARQIRQDRIERAALDGPERLALEALADSKAAPEDTAALEPGVNVDPEVIAQRRATVAAFKFGPPPSPPQHCRFCGVKLTAFPSGLWVHPNGQPGCPEAPRMSAEPPADGPEAPVEGGGAQDLGDDCDGDCEGYDGGYGSEAPEKSHAHQS